LGEVEGLDAEAVADEDDFTAAGLVDGGGKHPPQAGEDGWTPNAVAAEEGFGVAAPAEGDTEGFEFAAEGEVVVDFAIEDEDIPRSLIAHRLVTRFREIENSQSGVAEID
jgi:hypothetical protein